jgi:hypothetical protein
MADNSNDKAPAYSSNDDWAAAVSLLTGYKLPQRGEIFKDKLYGNNDIPLMKVEIDDWNVEPDLAEISAINAMSWRTQNSGWRPEGWNTDFVVPFFNGSGGAGSEVKMRKARITLLGTDAEHHVPAGGVDAGGQFGAAGNNLMPSDFKGWDSRPLGSYSFGGGKALEALMYDPHGTWRFAWNDIHVEDPNAVDLSGFERVAKSFDRAARFFHTSRTTIQSWEDELGVEDAAWRGQAAGVFWDLIHQLGITYENYEDTLPTVQDAFSKAGQDLRDAKDGVYNAVSNLHSTWNTWAIYTGNPLRWLHDILLEVTDDIWDNNLVKVRAKAEYHGGYYGGSTTWTNVIAKDGFRTSVNKKAGGSYGDLNNLATWKAIGDEAIIRWQQSVVDTLGTAGSKALDAVRNSWVGVIDTLQPLTTQSVDLKADLQQDKAEAEQEKADKEREEEKAHQAAMEEEARKEREEDKRHQKEMEEKADRERQEQEQHQKEQEEKADRERQQQEQHQKEQEEKADRERQQQEQHQKEQEQKAEQQQAQAQAQAQSQYEQQRKDQEEQEKKQEALQQKQEEQAKQQYQEQTATQAALQKQQEKKQEEQEQKQEALQQKQEEQAKQQYEQQRKDQEEQQKKQEELQQKQEEEAKQQYAQQQKTQTDYQQKQEDQAKQQYEQQRKDQADQEKQLQQQYQQLPGGGDQQQFQQQLQHQQDQFQNQLEGLAHNQIGSQTHVNPDGTVTTDYSDGSSTTINPHTGVETTTLPDGGVTTDHLSAGHSFTNPDGSTTTVNDDGTLTTHYGDGSTTTVNPRTGMATTHEPDGQTITTNLGGGATLPHVPYTGNGAGSPYEPELHDLPYNGSLGSATLSPGEQVLPGSAVSASGGYLPQGTRIDGTTTGGMPPAGSPTGGMGGMPMGGMGGMGGMGEKNGSGERVRQVYDDEDIVTSDGGSLGRRGRRGPGYEKESVAGRRASTASAYDPYGEGSEREQTESGGREREAWVPEEEDVWGTDEGGAPAVIG